MKECKDNNCAFYHFDHVHVYSESYERWCQDVEDNLDEKAICYIPEHAVKLILN